MDLPAVLTTLVVIGVLGTGLMVVGIVKTVRHRGWRQQKWAPPAAPWFIGAFALLTGGLVFVLTWAFG